MSDLTTSNDTTASKEPSEANEFLQEAEAERTGFVAEFVDFLKHNKKWWLVPILVVLVLFAALILLTSTGVAPFIYTLF